MIYHTQYEHANYYTTYDTRSTTLNEHANYYTTYDTWSTTLNASMLTITPWLWHTIYHTVKRAR